MSAIYLMLIILVFAWYFMCYFILVESKQDAMSKAFYCCLMTACVAALSFLVIIFGPSKLV